MDAKPVVLRCGPIARLLAQVGFSDILVGVVVILGASTIARERHRSLTSWPFVFAVVVGVVLVIGGLVLLIRCLRLRLVLDGDCVVVHGVWGSRATPLRQVAQVGLGSAGLGRALYFRDADGRPTIARGISAKLGEASPQLTDALQQVRTAVAAAKCEELDTAEQDKTYRATQSVGELDGSYKTYKLHVSRQVIITALGPTALLWLLFVLLVFAMSVAVTGSFRWGPWGLLAASLIEFLPILIGWWIVCRTLAVGISGSNIAVHVRRSWQVLDVSNIKRVHAARGCSGADIRTSRSPGLDRGGQRS
jgi:hypothetical protein